MVCLRNGGAETLVQVRLQRGNLFPLSLEGVILRKVEVNLDKAHEAHLSSLVSRREAPFSRAEGPFTRREAPF
jgi:hypothetical protein